MESFSSHYTIGELPAGVHVFRLAEKQDMTLATYTESTHHYTLKAVKFPLKFAD